MKGLSEMTALLAAGEDTSDALLIDTREPLDTELTQENAISAAQSFLNDMQTVFAEYGYSFFDDSSEKAAAEYAYSGASLLLSSSDASLFLWRIGLGNYEVILDAVTGIPVYLCGDISHAGVPLTKCEPYDLFWKAAAGAYNSRYMLGIDLYPRQMEVNEEPGTAGRIHTWKGQGEHCYLKVEFLQDEKKYTPFFSTVNLGHPLLPDKGLCILQSSTDSFSADYDINSVGSGLGEVYRQENLCFMTKEEALEAVFLVLNKLSIDVADDMECYAIDSAAMQEQQDKSKIFICNLSRAGSILFTGKIVVYLFRRFYRFCIFITD